MIRLKRFIPILCTSISLFNTHLSFAMYSTSHKTGYDVFYQSKIDEIIKHYTITQGGNALYNAVHLKLNKGRKNGSFKEAKALVDYLYRQSYSDIKILYSGMSAYAFKKMKFEFNGSNISGNRVYNQMLKRLSSKRHTSGRDRIIGIHPNKKLTMQHNNFLSTSVDEKVARNFGNIILEIEFENEIYGEYIAEKSIHPDEKEVLIPPGAVFEIINIQNSPKLSTDENKKILVSVKLKAQQNPFNDH